MTDSRGLYVALFSIHGLIRGTEVELGRDADTGGQVKYVLELARALSDHPDIERVELITRQILSVNVDADYGEPLEQIAEKAWIVRLPCGPHRYLRKEVLWRHLPHLIDHALQHFRDIGRVPDVIHSHYADAGAVAVRLGKLLDSVIVHTGHSLGRVKQQRLLDKGMTPEAIEKRYAMSTRIAAEESVIEAADLVVASTQQEVDEQYGLYSNPVRTRMQVVPPGVDLSRFRPPRRGEGRPPVADSIARFLRDPRKPMILALQRPDERKNLTTLIRAYGESAELREKANLVLFIGARDDITELPTGQRRVLREMLLLIDRYDLHGSVAYPKAHAPEDVPDVYRLAAKGHGVFVNPALTEPFGLTLIEAAASGLPIVATNDGGPTGIVELCRNGLLIDPLDPNAISAALLEVLTDRQGWRRRSRSGVRGANSSFSWQGHAARYVKLVKRLQRKRIRRRPSAMPRDRMVLGDRLIVCDIDNTLIGDRDALHEFLDWLAEHRWSCAFGIATGRVANSAVKALRQWGIPRPDVLITAVGSEIYYGKDRLIEDAGWRRAIDHRWDRERLREVLEGVPGLRLQPRSTQRPHKLSYFVEPDEAPTMRKIRRRIREAGLEARAIYSHEAYLDLLPIRASKGGALHYLAHRWGLQLDRILVAGDSGNDAEMLRSGAAGVVVGNHSPELEVLSGQTGIYFAQAEYARGILEGIEHYGFADDISGGNEDAGRRSTVVEESGGARSKLERIEHL